LHTRAATGMAMTADPAAARELVDELLATAASDNRSHLAALFVLLRQHSRALHKRVTEVRDEQADTKEAEAMHNELSTLLWQRAQLAQEIAQSLVRTCIPRRADARARAGHARVGSRAV